MTSRRGRAHQRQHDLLAAVERDVPPLPHQSTLLTFDYPAQAAPEVPVFDKDYDLGGALKLQSNDPTLHAHPIYAGVAVQCEQSGLIVAAPTNYGTFRVAYGSAFFLDVAAREGRRISPNVDCTLALHLLRPGRGF